MGKKLNIKHRKNSGFSLIELVVTLAIAGILMYYAIPAYSDFSKRQTLSNQTNDLLGDLGFARSLAIENGSVVTVTSANGNNWSNGWDISETSADGSLNVIRTKIELPDSVSITATDSDVTYNSLGALRTPAVVNFDIEILPDFPDFLAINVLPSGLASSNRGGN
ncbi:MAG: GspH/FimT family pseudopilin [Marinicellaceae bacterium]